MSREPLSDRSSASAAGESGALTSSEQAAVVWPRWLDAAAWLYATGAGVGLFPKAPGTAGSILGPLFVAAWQLLERPMLDGIVVTMACIAVGVVAAGRVASKHRCDDPGFVVCDEIIAFAVVFAGITVTWQTALIGFVWFRVFDISKPWPIRRLERLPGGWGIMADDLLAGAFASVALRVTMWLVGI